ncbi:MAG: ABC transporter ATP-binding protein [Ignavibacteria bacterium]|jgi:phospholipid/cholesterol/gamma-HCH transport system ATP-binding protein|nr:ABC transporter ATP-binding protein [Ignavibacteria bacterium]MDH7528597.1 ABC transporter ATP-binding protein [Ignavibacteria bacterium]
MIKIENLYKRFGKLIVLDGVTFEVPEGKTYVILGRSGTGKSVLLKCIVRLLEPDDGKIFINGNDILKLSHKELNELRKEIGFLFQSAALYDSMSVRENLSFPLIRHTKMRENEIEERVKEMLRLVGLEEAIDKMPSELSGGMRKRIGLARALILHPKIMLYDEPTTGLDPVTSKEIAKLILDMQKKFQMTNIVVTHDMVVALSTADKILLLDKGKFIFEGTSEELINSDLDIAQKFLSNKLD